MRTPDAPNHVVVWERDGVKPSTEALVIRIPTTSVPSAYITGAVQRVSDAAPLPEVEYAYAEEQDTFPCATAADDGRFRIGPLTGGRYRISLRCKDGALHDTRDVSLAPRQTLDLGVLRCD